MEGGCRDFVIRGSKELVNASLTMWTALVQRWWAAQLRDGSAHVIENKYLLDDPLTILNPMTAQFFGGGSPP